MADNTNSSNPTPEQQSSGPTQQQIEKQKELENYKNSIIQKINSGQTLSEQEITNIKNSNLFDNNQLEEISKINNNNNLNQELNQFIEKVEDGESLSKTEEKKLAEQYNNTSDDILKNNLGYVLQKDAQNKSKLPMNDESTASKKRFDREFEKHNNSGGGSFPPSGINL